MHDDIALQHTSQGPHAPWLHWNSEFNRICPWAIIDSNCNIFLYSTQRVILQAGSLISRRWHDHCRRLHLHQLLPGCCYITTIHLNEKTFFDLVTLTFDLWPWPLNLTQISFHLTYMPKFRSVCLSVRLLEWDTHTHRRMMPKLLHPPSRWCGM